MTRINEVPERRAFEIWWKDVVGDVDYDLFRRDADGDYAPMLTQAAWEAWRERASRSREYKALRPQTANAAPSPP